MSCEDRLDVPSEWKDLLLGAENEVLTLHSNTVFKLQAIADIYAERLLHSLAAVFRPTRIRSLLSMPLVYGEQCLGILTIFRNEIDTDITWAGRFNPDERQQRVRHSFEAWRELKHGQACAWTDEDLEMVRSVGTHLTMAVTQNRL